MSIPFAEFYKPFQPETPIEVAAGESAVIYEFDLRSLCPGYVGFIEKVATKIYKDTYIDWEIDGELVERLKRPIGTLSNPEMFNPHYFVREKIRFTTYNNDLSSHKFWVLCDGVLTRKII